MINKNVLKGLYDSGKSMKDISKTLGCSEHKITYWMQKFDINRRTRSEATYLKANPNGDPFTIRTNLTKNENTLLYLSLGIYWGEGTKAGKHVVRVSNTDPKMLVIFRKFLLEICQVNPSKIKYNIVCFNDTIPETASAYWGNKLEISSSKFGKITQIPSQGKGTYKNKSKYGVCSVSVSNIKLKAWIMEQINSLTPD